MTGKGPAVVVQLRGDSEPVQVLSCGMLAGGAWAT